MLLYCSSAFLKKVMSNLLCIILNVEVLKASQDLGSLQTDLANTNGHALNSVSCSKTKAYAIILQSL